MRITDPEVRVLAGISLALQAEYETSDTEWEGSPFAWIRSRPSRQAGAIGEKLIAGWLAAHGFNVTRSPDADADCLLEGRRVEVKFSTLWANGNYKFQQLRDQDYEFAICLGVSPFRAHCWAIPKADILRLWKEDHVIANQHGGARGSDTAWINVVASQPPDWIKPYGGTLAQVLSILSKATGFRAKSIREELEQYDA